MMTLYTAPFCPKCELAASLLKERGVPFKLSADTEKAVSLGIKEAPCLVSDSGRQWGLKEIISVCKGDGQFE